MFGRIAKVAIQCKGMSDPVVYSGLDVKFKFTDVPGTFKKNVSISVLNLDINTVRQVMSNIGVKTDVDWRLRPKVKLYVGYADRDKEPVLIFDGVGMSATMTQPPDVWLNIMAQSGDNTDQDQYTVELTGVHTIKEIIEAAAKVIGLNESVTFFDDDTTNDCLSRKENGYSVSGNRSRILSKLSEISGRCIMRTEGNKLFIGDVKSLSKVESSSYGTEDNPFELTSQDGIVGLPYWNWPYLYVKTMLNPKLYTFAFVNINCPQVPLVNDGNPYQIMNLSHNGQLRQGEWVSQMRLQPKNSSLYKDAKGMIGQ